MTAQSQVPKLYQSVIEDVINNVREAFMDEGVDESVLSELKNIWQNKLTASKVLESDASLPPTNDPMIAGPYIALQQQQNSNPTRHPGYQPLHHNSDKQSDSRPPAVPVSSVPMFTTLSHPGVELSDAASMAYSSILQSQQNQQHQQGTNGAATSTHHPAHAGSAGGSRAQLVAAAAAAQPQYLFASPGSVGPVIIPHSQAVRLQQQQQNRGGTLGRGSLPQVDGALDIGVRGHAVAEPVAESVASIKRSSSVGPQEEREEERQQQQRRPKRDDDEEEEESPASDPNFDSSSFRNSTHLGRTSSSHRVPASSSGCLSAAWLHSSSNYSYVTSTASGSPQRTSPRPYVVSESCHSDVNNRSDRADDAASSSSNISTATTNAVVASNTDCPSAVSSIPSAVADATTTSATTTAAELCLPSGESIRGKIIDGEKRRSKKVEDGRLKRRAPPRPKKGDKIEIVFQVDGHNSSSDEDDDDDDDGDMNEDDSSDRDPDDEDIPGVEDEPLNSEDDVSDNDPEELFDTENVVVCQYEKISRVRNKWRFYLKDGIMNIQGRDYVFLKASGEAEW